MDAEIAHMGVVDALLRLRLPRGIDGRVVRIYANDIELVEVAEFDAARLDELAAEYEVKQLVLPSG